MLEFEDFVAKQLSAELHQVEQKRLKALSDKKKATSICILIAVGAVLLGLVISMSAGRSIPLFIAIFLGIFISYFAYKLICGKSVNAFESSYKNQVVKGIAKTLQPEMEFYPYRGISKELFRSCGHYKRKIDRYKTEDLFEGSIGATKLRFAELHAEYKTTSRDSNGNTSTSWHTLFKGVFFMADFHKHFTTWVTVRPDNETGGFFGWVGQKIQGLSSSLVKLENPIFEKHFRVNAGDVTGAMYILTPDMQERLLDLRNSLGEKIIVSFQKSNVYITAPKRSDWFEPNINVSALSKGQIRKLGSQIQYYFSIVETLNLNTRIWTKE